MAARKKTKKRNPKRKSARARAKNPARKRRKNPAAAAPKRRRRKNAAATAPKRRRRRNASHASAKRPRRKNARRRRKNPGWSNLKAAGMAVLAGTGAALAASFINDGPLGNRGPGMQNVALAAEVLAAIYWIESPVILGGVVVGLTLVPVAAWFYNLVPLAAAGPPPQMHGGPPPQLVQVPPPPPSSATIVVTDDGSDGSDGMSALHRGNVRSLRRVDKRMSALHAGSQLGALHRGQPVRALHRPAAMGAFHSAPSTGELSRWGRVTSRFNR